MDLEVADKVCSRDTEGTGCPDRTVALEDSEEEAYVDKD